MKIGLRVTPVDVAEMRIGSRSITACIDGHCRRNSSGKVLRIQSNLSVTFHHAAKSKSDQSDGQTKGPTVNQPPDLEGRYISFLNE